MFTAWFLFGTWIDAADSAAAENERGEMAGLGLEDARNSGAWLIDAIEAARAA